MELHNARQWLADYVSRRAGGSRIEFEAIAGVPIYEVLDSLDLVELLAAVEEEFGVCVDPQVLNWHEQPSVRQLVDEISARVGVAAPQRHDDSE